MTKTEQQRIALALLAARPETVPGTKAIINADKRTTWYNCVTHVACCIFQDEDIPGWFFDAAGVPE